MNFIKKLSTSKNLTIVGVATIVGALALVAVAVFDGDDTTNIDWKATYAAISAGIGMILAKGASSTGGTVDGAGNPVEK